jgi:fluoride exporter
MKNFIYVGTGAALGACLRYAFGLILINKANLPYATFLINILGSLLIGYLSAQYKINSATFLFLGIGFCGGFTTFSAFSKELHTFITQQQYLTAACYAILSVVLGIAAFFLGLYLHKNL